MRLKSILFFSTFLMFFSIISLEVYSAPLLYDPKPINGTFIYGKSTDEFAININEISLDINSVKVFVRVKDPTSVWEGVSLTCINLTQQDWYCNTTVPGLESLVSDGKILLYYFEASNNQGEKSSNGSPENPLEVLVDRSPPHINFLNVVNNSYISNNKQVLIEIKDSASGLNASSPIFLIGNTTFNSTWQNLFLISANQFKTNYDVSQFDNNSSIILYVAARDKVGNQNTSKIHLLVDNELPTFDIISPLQSEVYGNVNLTLKVNDLYSGASTAIFLIQNINLNISCQNNICSSFFDSSQIPDGNYYAIFNVFDKANNNFSRQISLRISNTLPVIHLINLRNNSYIGGKYNISFVVINIENLRLAQLIWKNLTYSSQWDNATCANLVNNFTCYYLLDTRNLKEDIYELQVRVLNEFSLETIKSINFYVDNTKPVLSLGKPIEEYVNGTFIPVIIATDEFGLNENSAFINLSSLIGSLSCSSFLAGKKLVCSASFDTTQLNDGDYDLFFLIRDFADNENFLVEKVKIRNNLGQSPYPSEQKDSDKKDEENQNKAEDQIPFSANIFNEINEIAENVANFTVKNWHIIIIISFLVLITTFLLIKIKRSKQHVIKESF